MYRIIGIAALVVIGFLFFSTSEGAPRLRITNLTVEPKQMNLSDLVTISGEAENTGGQVRRFLSLDMNSLDDLRLPNVSGRKMGYYRTNGLNGIQPKATFPLAVSTSVPPKSLRFETNPDSGSPFYIADITDSGMAIRQERSILVDVQDTEAKYAKRDDGLSRPLDDSGNPGWLKALPPLPDEPPPPWPPLRVHENKVLVWGREYVFGKGFLPRQLTSEGHELLAAPIYLELTVNGKCLNMPQSSPQCILANNVKAFFRSHGSGDSMNIQHDGWIEFDGFVWSTLTVSPKGKPSFPLIQRLSIVIPVKPQYSTFYHYAGDYWSDSIVGNIGPEGWRTAFSFKPSVWVGNSERGICWLCESNRNWYNASASDAIEIQVRKNSVNLRIKIIDTPIIVSEPVEISFGFMVNPMKPLPDISRYRHQATWRGGDREAEVRKYDLDVSKIKSLGIDILTVHSLWARFNTKESYNPRDLKRFVKECHSVGINVIPYFALGMLNPYAYDLKQGDRRYTWARLWGGYVNTPPLVKGKSPFFDRIRMCPHSTEYAQYLFHSIKKAVEEYDFDGIYLDNVWPHSCKNRKHGCGYPVKGKLDKYGETFPILSARNLVKRVYYYLRGLNKQTYIRFHTSKKMFPAVQAFADAMLEGEEYFVKKEFEDIEIDSFRVLLGRQWGSVPELLCHHPWEPRQAILLAMLFNAAPVPLVPYGEGTGYSMKYEDLLLTVSRLWEFYDAFDLDGAEWKPYWGNAGIVEASDKRVKATVYVKRGEKAVFVFFNASRAHVSCTISVDFARIGLRNVRAEKLTLSGKELRKEVADFLKPSGLKLLFAPMSGYLFEVTKTHKGM